MLRFASSTLDQWVQDPNRKPAILRGARQVGKTWLVRDLANRYGLRLIELNFERFPNFADLFAENDPTVIIQNIEADLATTIDPESTLLFLDEIQAAPELFSKLRWFREEMPQLPVIAAGSLLEFALKKHQYILPVGRITYFYLEPLSFLEFVLALGNTALYQKLDAFHLEKGLPQRLHEKCLALYHDYCLVGGMPEVVQAWVNQTELKRVIKLQQDLLATYRDDFHKYGGEMDARLLSAVTQSVAAQIGNKFVYQRVEPSLKIAVIKKIFILLSQARVCQKIFHTTGNGLPLGAESNSKFFKALLIDIGLTSVQLGLAAISRRELKDLVFTNKGGLAEQFVGQQLRSAQSPLLDPHLFYWQRTGGRLGEIDYIIQHQSRVVPVEVKSGSAGRMKSLHQFMVDKDLDLAVRCNLSSPSIDEIQVKTTLGQPVAYRLLTIPIYMAECLSLLIDQT